MPLDVPPGIIQQLSPEQSVWLGTDGSTTQFWTFGGLSLVIPGVRGQAVPPPLLGHSHNPWGLPDATASGQYNFLGQDGSVSYAPTGPSWCLACAGQNQPVNPLEEMGQSP